MNPLATETARSSPRPARSPRVLVVDDEADLRELLELTLVGMGSNVDCAPDIATARAGCWSRRRTRCA